MKKRQMIIGLFLILVLMTGCDKTSSHMDNQSNSMDDVLAAQVEAADAKTAETTTEITTEAKTEITTQETTENMEGRTTPGVDYDLSKMNKNMVLATVSNLFAEPDVYEGVIVRAQGKFYGNTDPATGRVYTFVVVQDALACCTQGLEFTWDDGSHAYPDEYPVTDTEVVVTGEFSTYYEPVGSNFRYCILKNATMEIVSE